MLFVLFDLQVTMPKDPKQWDFAFFNNAAIEQSMLGIHMMK